MIAWKSLTTGQSLPGIGLDVTTLSVALVPVATLDLFAGHRSPEYARAQGQQDVYMNTIALQGIADRTVTDHLGPDTWVVRRALSMSSSVYPGDRLEGNATVTGVRVGGSDCEADFEVTLSTPRGVAVTAEITARRFTTPNPPSEFQSPTEGERHE